MTLGWPSGSISMFYVCLNSLEFNFIFSYFVLPSLGGGTPGGNLLAS